MAIPNSPGPLDLFQQGDVLFFQVELSACRLADGSRPVPRVERGLVVAEGEVTGHAHVIEEKTARLYSLDEILYLVVDREVECVHEEHDTVRLPPGTYQVGAVREVDYTAIEERERKEGLRVDLRQAPSSRPKKTTESKKPIDRLLRERRAAARRKKQREARERERREWVYVRD